MGMGLETWYSIGRCGRERCDFEMILGSEDMVAKATNNAGNSPKEINSQFVAQNLSNV
jgi:hypothetical protein